MQRRCFLSRTVPMLAAMGAWPALPARAQAYPSKALVIRVGYPPGGSVDAAIRDMLPMMSRELGQAVVVENQPGANGSIAALSVANAAPDGYTVLGAPGMELMMAPRVVATARYKPEAFRLAGLVGTADLLLLAAPQHSFSNAEQFLTQARARSSNPLSLAHWGPGSGGQLASADLQARADIKLLDVPYRGVAPILTDLGGGQIDLAFAPAAGPVIGMVKSGKVKAVAIAGNQRAPLLPNVPTFAEAGGSLAGFQHDAWSGFFLPRQAPDAALQVLNRVAIAYVQSAQGKERMATSGVRGFDPMTLEQLAEFFRRDIDKYSRLADRVHLVPQ